MTYRIFSRCAWQLNDEWPDGLEPYAVPPEKCQEIDTVDTIVEARKICLDHNDGRPYCRRPDYNLTRKQIHSKRLAPYWEFTEL